MWVSMKEMIELARPEVSAIGSILAVNLEQVQGILEAGVELRCPVIVALSEPAAIYSGLAPFIAMTRELAEQVPVPVSVLLDHVCGMNFISHAVEKGYTGFLADSREEDGERKLERLSGIKELCNKSGTFFEVEIGGRGPGKMNADFAGRVLAELRPDSACITIPEADRESPSKNLYEVTESIISSTSVPISMAGAGSWTKEDLERFVGLGVWKISIGTRTNQAFKRGLKYYLDTFPDRVQPRSYMGHAREEFRKEVRECLSSFVSFEGEQD